MPNLKLVRDTGWADKFRAYKILLNGTEVCKINEGEELSFPIEPGQYAIKAKIDWAGSREVRFDVADQDVVFVVESSMRGPALSGAVSMMFNPNSWILLTQRSTPGNKAKERERALDYDSAIGIWEELGKPEEAARVRKLKAELGATKVNQTVVHGDYVDDRDTIVKDSVINRSNVGAGGKSKSEELRDAKALLDDGIIDDAEFQQMKKEILGK
jgi:hypothetical protein